MRYLGLRESFRPGRRWEEGGGAEDPGLSLWNSQRGQNTPSTAPPTDHPLACRPWGTNLPLPWDEARTPCCPLSLLDLTSAPLRASFQGRQGYLIFPIRLSKGAPRVNKFRTLRDSEQLVFSQQHFTWSSGQTLPRTDTKQASAFRACSPGPLGQRRGEPQNYHPAGL